MALSESDVSQIGGYFELELPSRSLQPYPNALRLQSARAAFLALLQIGKPKRVWMPRLICDAMLSPLSVANIEVAWYDLDHRWAVDQHVNIATEDWLLYVNYYGVCKGNVNELMRRFPTNQIILDYSQAFFDHPEDVLATVYSPRKFFGLPDGGLLISHINVPKPAIQDNGSLRRVSHLIRRIAESPQAGYAAYRQAEESLHDCMPKRMSKLTNRIFSSIDFDSVIKKRLENYLYLHEKLGQTNQFELDTEEIIAPLCYPYITSDAYLRQRLIENNIFVPTYWKDSISRLSQEQAVRMIANCIPLPIDQRYGREHMDRIISVVKDVCS